MGSLQHSIVRISCVLAAAAVVSVAPAQGTAPVADNPIIFSSPVGGDQESPEDLVKPRQDRLSLADQIQAPHSLMSSGGADVPDPMPPASVRPAAPADDQKSWAESTPAEILGVQTGDNTKATREMSSQRKAPELSPLESYARALRLEQSGTTNLARAHASLSFLDEHDALSRQIRSGSAAEMQIFNRLVQTPQGGSDRDGALNGGFFSTPRPNQPTPQKVAELAAFEQELLNPGEPAPELRKSATGGGYKALPDPNLEPARPGFNSAGKLYQPLDANLGRPKKLTPLSGLDSEPATPSLTPAWAPQPAPWTSDKPQLFVNPVRKF
jgi:hypothetical protein